MTLSEAIAKADYSKPNIIPMTDKIDWINSLEFTIKNEIVDGREGAENIDFNGYNEATLNRELIAPAPYSEMYVKWLEAQIDYRNDEIASYNNAMAIYNNLMVEFRNFYNKRHQTTKNTILTV
jgi:hypothetical protein